VFLLPTRGVGVVTNRRVPAGVRESVAVRAKREPRTGRSTSRCAASTRWRWGRFWRCAFRSTRGMELVRRTRLATLIGSVVATGAHVRVASPKGPTRVGACSP
jgi:hypothetical protein